MTTMKDMIKKSNLNIILSCINGFASSCCIWVYHTVFENIVHGCFMITIKEAGTSSRTWYPVACPWHRGLSYTVYIVWTLSLPPLITSAARHGTSTPSSPTRPVRDFYVFLFEICESKLIKIYPNSVNIIHTVYKL